MNQLETNLALWAVCSILLFEILIIICLCRCCFNRIRPKKFYVKREEYEYLQDIPTGTQVKFQSTILHPPRADELALIGTIRGQKPMMTYTDGFPNMAFSHENESEKIPRVQLPLSLNCFELQSNLIQTAHLPPADYEIHSYPTDDFYYTQPYPPLPPRPTILDFYQHREDSTGVDNNELENFPFQSLRRPQLILPQAQRSDTSTEFYGVHFSNTVPKSILKSGTNTTPPPDLPTSSYVQVQRSRTSSKYDESSDIADNINTEQALSNDSPAKQRMRFASVSALNDIEWEVPREFQTIVGDDPVSNSNRLRTRSTIVDSKSRVSWQREMNIFSPYALSKDDATQQQQAFEY